MDESLRDELVALLVTTTTPTTPAERRARRHWQGWHERGWEGEIITKNPGSLDRDYWEQRLLDDVDVLTDENESLKEKLAQALEKIDQIKRVVEE